MYLKWVTFKVFLGFNPIVGIYPFMSKPTFEKLFAGCKTIPVWGYRTVALGLHQLPGIRRQNGKVDVQYNVQHLNLPI